MKTRALKSLCKQAQNECRVVIAGALLILPKDLVLIVRFAGLFSPCRFRTLFFVTAPRSPCASRGLNLMMMMVTATAQIFMFGF